MVLPLMLRLCIVVDTSALGMESILDCACKVLQTKIEAIKRVVFMGIRFV
jgi:hypothetical protein